MEDAKDDGERIKKLEEELQQMKKLVTKLESRIEDLEAIRRKGSIMGGTILPQPPSSTPKPRRPGRDYPPPPRGPEIG